MSRRFRPNRWNDLVCLYRYGSGDPAHMTCEQLEARVGYLRAHGRHFEALDLRKAWLSAPKVRQ